MQVRAIVGNDQKTLSLSYVVLGGAFATLVSAPIIGWLSDRLHQRLNFMTYGVIGIAVSVIMMAAASPHLPPPLKPHSKTFSTTQSTANITFANTTSTTTASGIMPSWGLGMYAIFYLINQVSNVAITTSFNALMADIIPSDARGSSSAVYAGSQAIGPCSS